MKTRTSTPETGVKAKKDGQGTYTFAATNEKYVGHYMKGQMTSGKWQSCNGDFFQGNFDNNNKPKGQGMWSFKNGNKVSGVYKQTCSANDDIMLTW
mmetsp:Transcript_43333/g.44028  ORF Transcript_43333/g.44028 Transcript_43333/m.44028 type:complete len:96 (-) Transcript_43333:161-448(-)